MIWTELVDALQAGAYIESSPYCGGYTLKKEMKTVARLKGNQFLKLWAAGMLKNVSKTAFGTRTYIWHNGNYVNVKVRS